MKNLHFAPNHWIDAAEKITVSVIGCGGTGARIIDELARMNMILLRLGRPGIDVCAYDIDVVTVANIGRQLYYESDLHKHKSECVVKRVNHNLSYGWKHYGDPMKADMPFDNSNIVISAVDKIPVRQEMMKRMKTKDYKQHDIFRKPFYFMDCGNSFDKGQIILGTVRNWRAPKDSGFKPVQKLPTVFDMFTPEEIEEASKNSNDAPSCSTWQAINSQDVYVNGFVAIYGSRVIWRLLLEYYTDVRGYFLNLKDDIYNPIKV